MHLEDIIRIFTFLLGAILQISILVLMVKRKSQQGKEIVFAFFIFAVLGWTFGIFISLFCGYLYRGTNLLERIFASVAVFSFTFFFPLLIHTLMSFGEGKYFHLPRWIRYTFYLVIYVPSLLLANSLWKILQTSIDTNFTLLETFITRFSQWIFVLLFVAWYLAISFSKKAEKEEDQRFLGILGWAITILIGFYFLSFTLEGRYWPIIGPYMSLLPQMVTFFIPPMMAYYIFCYNYMEYLMKREVSYCLLGVLVIAFYLFLIRPIGDVMETHFQINFRMVEGILVMVLVVFFDPVRRALQETFNRLFFREKQYYRKVFSDLLLMISRSSYMDLESLLDDVARTISRAMKIREVSFIFFIKVNERLIITETTLAISASNIEPVVYYLEKTKLSILNIYDLSEQDTDIIREMRKMKAFTIISIRNENTLIGILCIGKRMIRHQLRAEEEEMLTMLVNHMVIVFENTRLAREKFTLERKMYENEKLSSLGRLSASIAHEVKNPLSSIKAITQVMKEELPTSDPNQEGLGLIIGEIDRLSRVVKQLLLFARPHSGTLTQVDMNEIIRDVLLLLKHEANKNNVEIIQNIAEDDIPFLSDRDGLTEIFFNLVHNAIQALPDGGLVTIEKKIEYSDEEKKMPVSIKVTVGDNGPGIPPSEREKIFEPFYTTKQTGTGLGLTIVKYRLDKLKGYIVVKDNHPGTLLEVFLPIQHIDKVEIPEKIESTTEINQRFNS